MLLPDNLQYRQLFLMETLQGFSNESNPICCKNHSDISARYYVVDQPEIRYCKNCALNMALCGRKIQKQLTPQQQERKTFITSIVEHLKQNKGEISLSQTYNDQLITMIEKCSTPLQQKILELEKLIMDLTQVKLKVEIQFEREFKNKLANYFQQQGLLKNGCQMIKRQLDCIESNFGTYIQMESLQQFEVFSCNWRNVIKKTGCFSMDQQLFLNEKAKIRQQISSFQKEFVKISEIQFRNYFQFDQNIFRSKFEYNKQNQMQGDGYSHNCTNLVEELKLNLTANAQLKSRANKTKIATDRNKNKKSSISNENGTQIYALSKKYNH